MVAGAGRERRNRSWMKAVLRASQHPRIMPPTCLPGPARNLALTKFASSEKSVGHRYDQKASAGSSASAAREPDVG